MNNSCALISLLKFEHDYINQWIEHHVNIGISHFYLLVDNLTIIQPPYPIKNEYIDKVTLINCDNTLLEKYKQKYNITNIMETMHKALNAELLEIINIEESWITAIGIDQFIYLNKTSNIQSFLETIDDDCIQVIMPWSITSYNIQNKNWDNLIENMPDYVGKYNNSDGHANGLIRTKYMKCIAQNTHFFISKNNQKIFVIDEYFQKERVLDTWEIFTMCHNKMGKISFENIPISSFHFQVRNLNDIFVKSFLFWGNDYNIHNLISAIKTKTSITSGSNRLKLLNKNEIMQKYDLNIPKFVSSNTSVYYDSLLQKILNKYNVTLESYYEWIKTMVLNNK